MLQVTSIFSYKRFVFFSIAAIAILTTWLSLSNTTNTFTYFVSLENGTDDSFPVPPLPSHSNSRLLPFRYWNHRSMYPDNYTNENCMKLPEVSDIQYAAYSWQYLKVVNGSVYIYSAYYDQRSAEPLVRILIYTDVAPIPKLYCQLWFPNDNEPQTELPDAVYGWRKEWGGPTNGVNEPYILTCRCRRHSPEPQTPPIAVSVVTEPCGVATNVLDIQNAPFDNILEDKLEEEPKSNGTSVAVCLKWLHYRNDVSYDVIEWLQLIKKFGAKKAYIYVVRVHPNIRKVLDYYVSIGFVVLTELSHPPQVSGRHNSPTTQDFLDYRRELLPLNDCLYRNIGKYDWITAFDLDELIIPEPENTWAEFIDRETKKAGNFDALVFPNFYVLDEAQKDLVGPAKARMLSHTWRAENASAPGHCVKSFFKTSTVIAMHNHMPMSCGRACKIRTVNVTGPGRMLHYRNKCPNKSGDCDALHYVVRDRILDRWREPVLQEIDLVVRILGFDPLE